jgi:acetoacetyl-CoA synthetase
MDGRSEYPRLVEEMAASYLGELRTVQVNGPYYLAGYSFGSLVAYEMEQQLTNAREVVALLALLDPHPDDTEAVFGPEGVGDRYQWHRERFARGRPTDKLGYLGLLIQRRQRAVMRRLQNWRTDRYNVRGGYVPPTYRKAVFNQIAGQAKESYKRRPYPGSLTLITSGSYADAQRLAWGEYALGGLDLIELEVSHHGMVSAEEEIKLVSEALDARLRRAGR